MSTVFYSKKISTTSIFIKYTLIIKSISRVVCYSATHSECIRYSSNFELGWQQQVWVWATAQSHFPIPSNSVSQRESEKRGSISGTVRDFVGLCRRGNLCGKIFVHFCLQCNCRCIFARVFCCSLNGFSVMWLTNAWYTVQVSTYTWCKVCTKPEIYFPNGIECRCCIAWTISRNMFVVT